MPRRGAGWLGGCVWLLLHFCAALPTVFAITAPGTVVSNQAEVAMRLASGGTRLFPSNLVTFEVEVPPHLAFTGIRICPVERGTAPNLEVRPGYYLQEDGGFCGVTTWPGASAEAGATQPLRIGSPQTGADPPGRSLHTGDFFMLLVNDAAANRDPREIERIEIRITTPGGEDEEVIQLLETAGNSGIFASIVVAEAVRPRAYDGRIALRATGEVAFAYRDALGTPQAAAVRILVDPLGVVFDSSSGEPLDGVTVTLLDAATGRPAQVFGGDGRSSYPSTVRSGREVQDSGGAVYAPEPGRFVFPLVASGTYRYQVTLPDGSGYTYPSQANDETMQTLPGGPWHLAAGSRGETFAVGTEIVRIDVPVDPEGNLLLVSLQPGANQAAAGDFVAFTAEVTNRRGLAPVAEVVLQIALPTGFRLEKNSLRLGDRVVSTRVAADGRSFAVDLPPLAGGAAARLELVLQATTPPAGRALFSAQAANRWLRSNAAAAQLFVRDELMATRGHILGQVTEVAPGTGAGVGVPGVAVYLETGSMAVTDPRGLFHFAGLEPGAHVVQVDRSTLPKDVRLTLTRDHPAHAGTAHSQMIELLPGGLARVDFSVEKSVGSLVGADNVPAALTRPEATPAVPTYDQAWIDAQAAEPGWLLPAAGESPALPVTRIVVRHRPGLKVEAFLDGEPVPAINHDGVLTGQDRRIAASLWSGVPLHEGDNVLELVTTDIFGNERARERRVLHYASPPVRGELVAELSTLTADGVTGPVLAVRLLDASGHPARRGLTGRYHVEAPYAAVRPDKHQLALVPAAASGEPFFTVGENGVALLALEPTNVSGTVRVRLALARGLEEVQADLRGGRSEWLVVGLAEGTSGHGAIRAHLETLAGAEGDTGQSADGRVAFFAQGRIKGGWLLSAAYDSAKKKISPRRLHGLIDPDAYYTVYGDLSERQEAAPSSGKLYVKLARGAAEALLGDFTLDWTSTGFASYGRELHGARADWRGERLRVSAFESEAGLSAMRDELRGDGSSGPYRLSRRGVVAFSERVTVEERDRLRPALLVAERTLQRLLDYVIDPLEGTIRLSRPLSSVAAGSLNPQFLVVRYELEDADAGRARGVRVETVVAPGLTVGAVRLEEDSTVASASVTGVDARLVAGPRFEARAEVARSRQGEVSADAWQAEANWHDGKGDWRAYVREAGAGFGLGQLGAAQLGRRQAGIEGRQRLTDKTSVRALVFQEAVLGAPERRLAGEVFAEHEAGAWTWRGGMRAAQDERAGGETPQSVLLAAGVARRFAGDKVELRLDREQSVAGEAENADFPARTVLSLAYAVTAKTKLVVEQEWSEAQARRTSQTRLGLKTGPWAGGQLFSGVAHEAAGGTTTGLMAWDQKWQVSPELALEGGYENSRVLAGEPATTGVATVSPSSGLGGSGLGQGGPFQGLGGYALVPQGEREALFAGAHWKPGTVLYNGRIEHTAGAGSSRTGLLLAAQAEPGADLGVLGSVTAYQQSAAGRDSTFVDVRLGVAWRPAQGSTIWLNRLDLVRSPLAEAGGGAAWRIINNLHLHQQLGEHTRLSLHLGLKHVTASVADRAYASWTSLAAFEIRRDVGRKWDLGLNGALLSAWTGGSHRYQLGLSAGRTIAKNMWVGAGYNFSGLHEADFTAARYTRAGVYVQWRMKFDEESLAGLLRAIREE